MPVGRGTPSGPGSCILEQSLKFSGHLSFGVWLSCSGIPVCHLLACSVTLSGELAMFGDSEKAMEGGSQSQAQASAEALGEGLHPVPLPAGPGSGTWVWARAPPGTPEPAHTCRPWPGLHSHAPISLASPSDRETEAGTHGVGGAVGGRGDTAYLALLGPASPTVACEPDRLPLFSGPQFPHLSKRSSRTRLAGAAAGNRSSNSAQQGWQDSTKISSPREPTRPPHQLPPCQTPAVRPLELRPQLGCSQGTLALAGGILASISPSVKWAQSYDDRACHLPATLMAGGMFPETLGAPSCLLPAAQKSLAKRETSFPCRNWGQLLPL